MKVGLETELATLLNKHSIEGGSDTPDFILARYLLDCLRTWDRTVALREHFHGRHSDAGGE